MEKWKDVKGYEGLYEISNHGKLRNSKKNIIKLQTINGYKRYLLSKNQKRKAFYIHRLVAEHFLEVPKGCNEVNHIDEDKSNNRVENLEWCNRKYNMNYGTRNKRSRETYLNNIKKGKIDTSNISKRQCKKVINLTTGEIYESAKQASEMTGVKKVSSCCTGKRKTVGGMIWSYLENYNSLNIKNPKSSTL